VAGLLRFAVFAVPFASLGRSGLLGHGAGLRRELETRPVAIRVDRLRRAEVLEELALQSTPIQKCHAKLRHYRKR
jgi:hypothetical protein